MTTVPLRLGGSPGALAHPAVASRRIRDLLVVGLAGSLALALAIGIAVAMPQPNYPLVLGAIVGAIVLVVLVASARLEYTVMFLAIYLGCIGGPIKLLTAGGVVTAALQDVLIIAICLGMLIRAVVNRQRLERPPLSGWVLAFVLSVLIEAFNPKTLGLLKSFAGFREQLQWVPFFFFGYMLMRSKDRLRKMFVILGVIALANGVASTFQTQMSPAEVASLGPGYYNKVYGAEARKYKSEGVARVRPTGLGDDAGVGGGFGDVALAGSLALMGVLRRRRWLALILCLGSLSAIATGLGRLQVVGGVLAVIAYALLASSAGKRFTKPLMALLGVIAIAIPAGIVYVSAVGGGVFSRYESVAPGQVANTATSYKQRELLSIPHIVSKAPFGFGLGTAGPAKGFGGTVTEELEGHNVNAETQYNFIVDELGLPGLLAWTGFVVFLIVLAFRRLRFIADLELQILLAAVFAPVTAMFFMAFDGPISASQSNGAFFWFAAGIAAYWLAGRGFALARRREEPFALSRGTAPAT